MPPIEERLSHSREMLHCNMQPWDHTGFCAAEQGKGLSASSGVH